MKLLWIRIKCLVLGHDPRFELAERKGNVWLSTVRERCDRCGRWVD